MLIKNLIKQATKVGSSENVIRYIEYLYQFEKFRNILNLTLSLIKQNRLSFEMYQEGLVEFLHKVYQDIEQNLKQANILVQKIIGQVIFKEIQAYQIAKSRASELFARYFELFA